MIDTHSHLFKSELSEFIPTLLRTLDHVNLKKIMLVGIDNDSTEEIVNLAKTHEVFAFSLGIHPTHINESSNIDYDFNLLEENIKKYKPVAIGECGLDLYHDSTFYEEQKAYFRRQIELSLKYDLPLIIHTRSCIQDTYDLLCEYKNLKGVIHCYSGSYEMALKFIELGFYISFAGPLTFKNATTLKDVAKRLPIDKILIETDSPYLAPMPLRGTINNSLNTIYILKEMARLRDMDYKVLDRQFDQNAIALFKFEVLYETSN